jgi:hypothetical protein
VKNPYGDNYLGISLLLVSYIILLNILLKVKMNLLEIISVGFNITDQLLIRYSIFVRYWRKEWEYS